jgi:hypothetical protein
MPEVLTAVAARRKAPPRAGIKFAWVRHRRNNAFVRRFGCDEHHLIFRRALTGART